MRQARMDNLIDEDLGRLMVRSSHNVHYNGGERRLSRKPSILA